MAVNERIHAERQRRYERKMEKAEAVIPHGIYCYTHTGKMVTKTLQTGEIVEVPETVVCPYWKLRKDKPYQRNGYCRFMKEGDWQGPFGLLWDQVKECGVNYDEDENED